MNGFGVGDVVGLLLDCDAGTLTVEKNGAHRKSGADRTDGGFCWGVPMYEEDAVHIAVANAAKF
jgi:hypothetical protein